MDEENRQDNERHSIVQKAIEEIDLNTPTQQVVEEIKEEEQQKHGNEIPVETIDHGLNEDSYINFSPFWKKKDGTKIPEGTKAVLKLNLLNEVTEYLKVNEPKKSILPRLSMTRRPRNKILYGSTLGSISDITKINKNKKEKKPRKDCVCGLDTLKEETRNKILILLKNITKCNDQQLTQIIDFSNRLVGVINEITNNDHLLTQEDHHIDTVDLEQQMPPMIETHPDIHNDSQKDKADQISHPLN
ncbi:hypothetical protein EDI_085910 [Entamoeba dispar SAW760]|uniref:Uncharacterized protein n=1 Tax=Entamoeba dispar (strain ATCC PRA-260 / SAW760) TaxID=370354 RepID=B0EF39_ENTDS|nr:uncharacterized protein EDI_085910 [Entamoeba dispar SAW760]EDR26888.1 hypothetical protein EDI_085910 [Entamoeba dispar SAW760]|eukprot:EDR26888.1 hypothetical protein EDI_085910 [Entamoeba dispar SAW760]